MSSTESDDSLPVPLAAELVAEEAFAAPAARRAPADRVFLRDVPFFGRHGVFPEEQVLGQRFVLDVEWWLDTRPAAWADDAALTVSYQAVYDHMKAVVEDEPVHLIETLAERIATRLLDHFPAVEQVRVVVRKPGAPISGVFGDVGVEIIRHS